MSETTVVDILESSNRIAAIQNKHLMMDIDNHPSSKSTIKIIDSPFTFSIERAESKKEGSLFSSTYILYVICFTRLKDNKAFRSSKRYSELKTWYYDLIKNNIISQSGDLQFPEYKLKVNANDPNSEIIIQRIAELQTFFRWLFASHLSLISHESVVKFFNLEEFNEAQCSSITDSYVQSVSPANYKDLDDHWKYQNYDSFGNDFLTKNSKADEHQPQLFSFLDNPTSPTNNGNYGSSNYNSNYSNGNDASKSNWDSQIWYDSNQYKGKTDYYSDSSTNNSSNMNNSQSPYSSITTKKLDNDDWNQYLMSQKPSERTDLHFIGTLTAPTGPNHNGSLAETFL